MSGTSSLQQSRRDPEFMSYEQLDVGVLTQASRDQDHRRETFDAVLETYEQIATDLFATCYQKSDREESVSDGTTARVIPEVAVAINAVADRGSERRQEDRCF